MFEVQGKCPMCGKVTVRTIDATDEQMLAYQFGFDLVQNIFPDLSVEDREFLITGYCDDCQKVLFEYEEEE